MDLAHECRPGTPGPQLEFADPGSPNEEAGEIYKAALGTFIPENAYVRDVALDVDILTAVRKKTAESMFLSDLTGFIEKYIRERPYVHDRHRVAARIGLLQREGWRYLSAQQEREPVRD